jgi:hypothetical protein
MFESAAQCRVVPGHGPEDLEHSRWAGRRLGLMVELLAHIPGPDRASAQPPRGAAPRESTAESLSGRSLASSDYLAMRNSTHCCTSSGRRSARTVQMMVPAYSVVWNSPGTSSVS